ncbi:16S rRNA (uracil(1498)-N(3))-methyltransferase [Sanguibacter antarcticus]|uniref:Ribosomal RNA small subunit methyltransferase E n=1 Tax=Sanguibacter antarcticus TaxID=372484 RepID=A0A2A9E3L3_9MICO|nr:16S rRNA (uracil(1498)-N(3))-methyltransferase [Sanguibacter antarcticus]PFG32790.1 16S rRNA (uracil1498-N3)-methyltransferase [Sanguibacter antarcticus]
MSAPVFLAEPGALSSCEPGSTFVLDGDEGRHAGVVQRRGPGERIDVVDGAGVRLRCVIASVQSSTLDLVVEDVVHEPADGVEIVLVQALAKGDRDEMAVEAATEVGVDAILPWQAERSVVVWRGDRAAKSRARWVGVVRAATKQARRAVMPRVGLVVDAAGLVTAVERVRAGGGTTLVLHEEATRPLAEVELPATRAVAASGEMRAAPDVHDGDGPDERVREVMLVVGPEGGISDRELARLVDAGAVPVRLGPHVLRTSTAGPVAAALVAQRLGRWR